MLQSRKKTRQYTPYIVIGIIVVILVWWAGSWIRGYRSAIAPVSSEVIDLSVLSKQSLIKKIVSLQSDLEHARVSENQQHVLEQENASLKAELGRPISKEGTIARIITRPNQSLYDTVIIDAGEENGVSVGKRVYAFGDVALGTISAVENNQATILLFSAPGRETSGTVTNNNATVTLIGRGGGEYEIRMPRDVLFQEGATITEQSIHSVPLAIIQKIISDPRDPFQRLLAKIPLNIQNISWVIVR